MKKMNNKGFTIVELVIVIAVIAILAAVMIPTFSGIVAKAQQSSAIQQATATWKELYAIDLADGTLDMYEGSAVEANKIIASNAKYASYGTFTYTPNATGAKFTLVVNDYTASFDGTTWTATKLVAGS